MKVQAIGIVIALCFVTFVNSQASCDPTTQPFLKWLNGVDASAIVTTPDISGGWSVCGEIWGTASQVGTCCKVDLLKGLFQKRIDLSKLSWTSFMRSLYKLRDRLSKINKLYSILSDGDLDTAAGKGIEIGNLNVDAIKSIFDSIKKFEEDLTAFKSGGAKECFAALSKARANAFCAGCWSYGGTMFADNTDAGKPPTMVYKDGACNNLFTTCGSTWKFLFITNTILSLAANIAMTKLGIVGTVLNTFDILIKPSLTTNVIALALIACTSFKIEGVCTQENVDNLCTAFFSWSGEDRIARELMDEKNIDEIKTRILQSPTDGGSSSSGATGVDISATVTMPSNTDIDASTAGDAPSSERKTTKNTCCPECAQ